MIDIIIKIDKIDGDQNQEIEITDINLKAKKKQIKNILIEIINFI
jgi:hypothetical protein